MLTATDLELAAGGRLLLAPVTFQIRPGDRIGLVGRNGRQDHARARPRRRVAARVRVRAPFGLGGLPAQDPRTGDLSVSVRDRVLAARGLDVVLRDLADMAAKMGTADDDGRDAAMRRYGHLEEEFVRLGGWTAEAQARAILSSLGLPERVFAQELRTLSGGQRRRVELARVLFSGASTLLLDEPTNHLDADSVVWLRSFLRAHEAASSSSATTPN